VAGQHDAKAKRPDARCPSVILAGEFQEIVTQLIIAHGDLAKFGCYLSINGGALRRQQASNPPIGCYALVSGERDVLASAIAKPKFGD